MGWMPEDTLRGLMWHCNNNCGNSRETEKNKSPFSREGSKATLWPLACSQSKGLCPREYQRRANWLPFMALLGGREAGEAIGKGPLQSRLQRLHVPTKLWAVCQSLTTCSWDLESSYLPGVLESETRCPEETHGPPGTVPSQSNQEPEWLWLKKCTLPWGGCVAHPLWALPTHASGVCWQRLSLSTAQLSKWAK